MNQKMSRRINADAVFNIKPHTLNNSLYEYIQGS